MQPNTGYEAFRHLVGECLDIFLESVDQFVPGFKWIRAVHQSTWSKAANLKGPRSLEYAEHGCGLCAGASEGLSLLVIPEVCSIAEYMVRQLDHMRGRSRSTVVCFPPRSWS